MLGLLWLIPAIPFASALALAVLRIPRKLVAWIAAGATAASAVISLLVTISFLSAPPAANAYTQVLWTWFDVGGLRPEIAFYLDPISLIMTLVVAFVGFLIHLLFNRIHDRRRGLQPVLRLHESVFRFDADAASGEQSIAALSGVGRRRPVQLFADRVLVSRSGQRPRRPQSVHRDPRWRHCPGDRAVPSIS